MENSQITPTRRQLLAGSAGAFLAALAPRFSFAQGGALPGFREVEARAATASLLEAGGPLADIWGYDGGVPGPVIRVGQGERVRVRLRNALPQATTIHWHGIRIDNAHDGVANLTQDPVPQGGTFDYDFVAPDAGTFWYHPHNRSWEQLARGLYGVLIVDEKEPPRVDRDLVLQLDDWRLDNEGRIHEDSFGHMMDWSHAGRLGNVLTVNGKPFETIQVRSGERLRLRMVNSANARVMGFRLTGAELTVIALDGQPVEPHAPEGDLVLAPGERIDLIADMSGAPGSVASLQEVSGRDGLEIVRFICDETEVAREHPLESPVGLAANPLSHSLDLAGAATRELLMEGGAMGGMRSALLEGEDLDMRALVARGKVWAFNGVAGMEASPFFTVPRGQTVQIPIVNDTGWPHAIHVHGHHFRVLERNGEPVRREAWKDTVLVQPRERATLAFVADNPGKWMLHCHMLEHQAGGMATWFEVS